jgi:FdhD protein
LSDPRSAALEVRRIDRQGRGSIGERRVVREELLVVRIVDGESFSLMRTPGDEEALALGFLLAEGWIEGKKDIADLEVCEGRDTVKARLSSPATAGSGSSGRRNLVIHSSCGLCGREDALPFLAALEPVERGAPFPVAAIHAAASALRRRQPLFEETGGSHAVALFDRAGRILCVGEDIGRHAAFDKMAGRSLLDDLELPGNAVFLSGRASLEMVAKAGRARVALLAAVGAASDAAVTLAQRLGLTLCGFVRDGEMTVYCGAVAEAAATG